MRKVCQNRDVAVCEGDWLTASRVAKLQRSVSHGKVRHRGVWKVSSVLSDQLEVGFAPLLHVVIEVLMGTDAQQVELQFCILPGVA